MKGKKGIKKCTDKLDSEGKERGQRNMVIEQDYRTMTHVTMAIKKCY